MTPSQSSTKSLSYSAPISVTLAGDNVTSYGRPAVMLAINKRAVVSVSRQEYQGDHMVKGIYTKVYQAIFGEAPSSMKILVNLPNKPEYRSVQSAIIVCFVALLLDQKNGKKTSIAEIQKTAFAIEKKLFAQYSHAQTVNSMQGGLVYYRKEFEFYKTIMKLPMKLPHGFLTNLGLKEPVSLKEDTEFREEGLHEQEKKCKRLVFAIAQENITEWKQEIITIDAHSDMYLSEGNDTLEESHTGLIVG